MWLLDHNCKGLGDLAPKLPCQVTTLVASMNDRVLCKGLHFGMTELVGCSRTGAMRHQNATTIIKAVMDICWFPSITEGFVSSPSSFPFRRPEVPEAIQTKDEHRVPNLMMMQLWPTNQLTLVDIGNKYILFYTFDATRNVLPSFLSEELGWPLSAAKRRPHRAPWPNRSKVVQPQPKALRVSTIVLLCVLLVEPSTSQAKQQTLQCQVGRTTRKFNKIMLRDARVLLVAPTAQHQHQERHSQCCASVEHVGIGCSDKFRPLA